MIEHGSILKMLGQESSAGRIRGAILNTPNKIPGRTEQIVWKI
jgi:hypothetical protein